LRLAAARRPPLTQARSPVPPPRAAGDGDDAGQPDAAQPAAQRKAVKLWHCPEPSCTARPEGFKSKQALKNHAQSHVAGEEGAGPTGMVLPLMPAPGGVRAPVPPGPYHCPDPSCGFGQGKKVLKTVKTALQHAKTHAAGGAASFVCELCAKTFSLRYRLTEHSKTCGKKPFHCKCGLALGHKSSLKTHIAQWNKTAPGEHEDDTATFEAEGAAADAAGAAAAAAGGKAAELHAAALAVDDAADALL